jgi:enamine deaminase RidA (YjgF/YER057c/UK114 family)
MAERRFTRDDATRIGETLGVDWTTAPFDVEEYRRGLEVELEHGVRDPRTDVSGDDELVTGKIALAHLYEFPDYYARLAKMEEEARAHWAEPPESGPAAVPARRTRVPATSRRAAEVGYSRAVCVGDHVFVAGTAPVTTDGSAPPADAYLQAKRCLEIIGEALAAVGAKAEHVVRTRVYLAHADDIDGVGRAHGEVFRETRPALTALVPGPFINPRWLVQIEAEAIVPQDRSTTEP